MKVVAVTSCATGIAHTYMAAEAIMKVCKERGYKCKVEKQGALGLEDKLRDLVFVWFESFCFCKPYVICKNDQIRFFNITIS